MKGLPPAQQLSRATLERRVAELELELSQARRETEAAHQRAALCEQARREAWAYVRPMALARSDHTSS